MSEGAAKSPVNPDSTPPPAVITPELREVLNFVGAENQRNRDYLKHLVDMTAKFIGFVAIIIAGIVGFFGYKTWNEVRSQVKTATAQEVQAMRTEVRNRIDKEFQTERLQQAVREAAREQTTSALKPIIADEVAKKVDEAQGTIIKSASESITQALQGRVDKSLKPIEGKIKAVEELSDFQGLALQCQAGDAFAFDRLMALSNTQLEPAKRVVVDSALRNAIDAHQDKGFYMGTSIGRNDKAPLTLQDLRAAALSPDVTMRKGAADSIGALTPADKQEFLADLVRLATTDGNLAVRDAAVRSINGIAGQKFGTLDREAVQRWWTLTSLSRNK